MNLNSAHIHLLLNHLPIIGAIVGLLLLVTAVVRKSDELKRVSLAAFVLTALIIVPVYLTVEPTAGIVERLPDVTEALVDEHQDAALISFLAVGVLGVHRVVGTMALPSDAGSSAAGYYYLNDTGDYNQRVDGVDGRPRRSDSPYGSAQRLRRSRVLIT